jgi:hypothetical protein
VPLPRLPRAKPKLGLGHNAATLRDANRALARALERQRERLDGAESKAVEVQLLGQITSAEEWPKLLAYWQRRNPSGVGAWPRRLEPDSYALNLWPLPATARPRLSAPLSDVRTRQPKKLLCTPGLTTFSPSERGDAATALAVLCATWLEDVGSSDFDALRLAPPLLEAWAPGGRLLSREVLDFDLEWTLAAAEV